jgi:hypothetical protein
MSASLGEGQNEVLLGVALPGDDGATDRHQLVHMHIRKIPPHLCGEIEFREPEKYIIYPQLRDMKLCFPWPAACMRLGIAVETFVTAKLCMKNFFDFNY